MTTVKQQRTRSFLTAIAMGVALTSTSACGGGGGGGGSAPGASQSVVPAAGNQSGTVPLTISILIPTQSTTSSTSKKPLWIAQATQGLLVQAVSTTTNQPTGSVAANISQTSPACNGVAKGRVCTVPLTVPPGPQLFTFTTYNTPPVGANSKGIGGTFGTATPIGIAYVPQTIIQDQANVINATLGGIVASAQATLTTTSVNFIPPASPQLVVTLSDPSGNQIIGGPWVDQNGNPVTLTVTPTEDANKSVLICGSTQNVICASNNIITPGTPISPASQILINYTGLAAAPFTSTISVQTSNGITPTTQPTLQILQPQFRTFGATAGITVYPQGIATGSDGDIWVATFHALGFQGGLVRITPSGTVQNRGGPFGSMNLVSGIDYNLWITGTAENETALVVYKINPGGIKTTYNAPGNPLNYAPASDPIIVGPDDNLWYTDQGTRTLNTITTAGVASTPLNLTGSNEIPYGLAGVNSPGDSIWFTQCPGTPANGGCSIGQFPVAGNSANTFPASTSAPAKNMYAIVYGSDGNLWFTQGPQNGQYMVCMNKVGTICGAYPIQGEIIQALTTNPDTAIWYADQGTSTIGRVMLNGNTLYLTIPDADGLTGGIIVNAITTGPDKGLWYTETDIHGNYAVGTVI